MKNIIGLLCLCAVTHLWANVHLVYENVNITELRGVFALSNNMVWAVGTDGKVLKSTDNGYSWAEVIISGASDYHLNSVFFATQSIGCIVGEKKADPDRFKGIIYRTTDGGANWYPLPTANYASEKYVPFKQIVFDIVPFSESPNIGYIAAGEGWIYKTTDYGEHWTRELVDASKQHCFHGIDISFNDDVYAVGDAGNTTGIVATKTSSGWQVEYPFSGLNLNFFDVALPNGDAIIVGSI